MKSGASVTQDNFAAIIRAISDIAKKDVLVGIPDSAPDRKDGPISNAQIGYILETGSPAKNIPARPFLVPGVVAVQGEIADRLGKAADAALDGSSQAAERQLTSAGITAENSVKQKINSNIQPELADSTLEARRRRGVTRENTLVDTGQLRNSVTHVVRNK
ncbi:hypothetical protein NDK50_07920 [Paraburkholderia bryophila]|uniref:hypothetical protein n=1 Tax=Paraburkholderia bryophila TaxID=420952 RepID=UPI0023496235|nr:hypothetical protein [Paraburkholderia bryophila]WCM21363.1 hypothetical protein NDK50_07920 [Paraburkholderia bryophila]